MKAPRKTIVDSFVFNETPSLCSAPNSQSVATLYTDVINGTPQKDWKVLIAKDQNASTAYLSERMFYYQPLFGTLVEKVRCNLPSWHDHVNNIRFQSGYGSFSTPVAASDSTTRDIALLILKRKLADDIKQFKLAVPVAELREFHGLVTSIADLSSGALRRHGGILSSRYSALDRFKYASEAWLTYSFGVKPMINDVKAVAESLAAFQQRQDFHARYTGTFQKSYNTTWKSSDGTPSSGGQGTYYYEAHNNLSYQFIAGVSAKLRSSQDYSLVQHFQLDGLGALPSVGWELLPYSWLLDYFVNVGDVIEDVWSKPAGNTIYVVECKRHEMIVHSDYRNPLSNPALPNKTMSISQNVAYHWVHFSRTPLAAIPHRTIRLRTQNEIAKNAVNKLLNLTAVLGVRR